MKTEMFTLIDNIKKFKLKSFFVRNLIIVILAILIPVVAIGVLFCAVVQNSADKEIEIVADSTLETVKKTVDMIIRTSEKFAIQTSYEQNVENFMYSIYKPNDISKVQSKIGDNISSFINVYPYIHSVYVYSEKRKLILHNNEISNVDKFKDKNWMYYYNDLSSKKDIIVPRKYGDAYPCFISVICGVGVDEKEKSGCIVVNIDVEKINEAISEENGQHSYFLLTDEQNTIFLSQDIKNIGKQYSDISEIISNDNTDSSAKDYIISESPSQWYNLKYSSVTPKFYFGGIIQEPIWFMLLLLILLIMSTIIITLLISFRTYVPVHSLLSFLTPEELNDSQHKPYDEISYIIENVEKTVDKNKELEQELNYKLLLLNKAQLYALQTQINPHFINNVLEMINWAAINEIGLNNKVSKMIRALSKLMNISLDSERYLISVGEELKHANIYTYIMNENYGDELNFIWDFEKGIHDCKILKLTLQPIIENAIEHGIKPKRDGGEIKIYGRIVNGDIQLTIQDNGVGMNEDDLEVLRNDLKNSTKLSGKHIGIRNVNQRIKLVFGDDYGLSIDSEKGKGTTVTILVPKVDF